MGGSAGVAAWVQLGVAILFAWVLRVGKFAWNDIWDQVIKAVAEAERNLEGQAGLIKRDAVLAAVFAYIDGIHLTAGVERWILRSAIVALIDMAVAGINWALGHNWVAAMDAAKHDIETRVPWLADEAVPAVG